MLAFMLIYKMLIKTLTSLLGVICRWKLLFKDVFIREQITI